MELVITSTNEQIIEFAKTAIDQLPTGGVSYRLAPNEIPNGMVFPNLCNSLVGYIINPDGTKKWVCAEANTPSKVTDAIANLA